MNVVILSINSLSNSILLVRLILSIVLLMVDTTLVSGTRHSIVVFGMVGVIILISGIGFSIAFLISSSMFLERIFL